MKTISLYNLGLIFVPVLLVLFVAYRWGMECKTSLYAMARMLVQLLLIGYCLIYIFESDNSLVVLSILLLMLLAASWISLRTLSLPRTQLFMKAFVSIFVGGLSVLFFVSFLVLELQPWYQPSYLIPLAGMIFANAMNGVSLAGERLEAELKRAKNYEEARLIGLRAALIPITNSLFAVGLVSLPGMMTGQILSGIDPVIAVRYQVMVMCMTFATVGISSMVFLSLIRFELEKHYKSL